MELVPRFFQDIKQSYFLFGPRGTDKYPWIKNMLGDAVRIDLLDPEVFQAYSARPERLQEIAKAQEPGATIVMDEIQKIP